GTRTWVATATANSRTPPSSRCSPPAAPGGSASDRPTCVATWTASSSPRRLLQQRRGPVRRREPHHRPIDEKLPRADGRSAAGFAIPCVVFLISIRHVAGG